MCELAQVLFGLHEDGKKFRGEIAFANGIEIEVATVTRRREVEAFVKKALRCIGMRIDDYGGAMNVDGGLR